MIHRMREYDDMDATLWEFSVEGYEQFKYRVTDASIPMPGLESTTLGTGEKYWTDVQHPEEINITFRETKEGHIFSFLWGWQNQIYDFEKNVFKVGNNGGKKNGLLSIQKPRLGGLLNFARIKLLQELNYGGQTQTTLSYLGQAGQIADILAGGRGSEALEDFLFEDVIKFSIKGMRPKKIDDFSFTYNTTDPRDVSITFIVDDIKLNSQELFSRIVEQLGSSYARGIATLANSI